MVVLKFVKTKSFIFLFSIFISMIFLVIFSPVLTTKNLIFPYSIHSIDIAKDYPKIWFYIKIIYCLNLFVSNFLILNSIISFFKINPKFKIINNLEIHKEDNINDIKLLIGTNSITKEEVFITEKGLYQNILITGTIGSRKNKFSYVSIFKAIIKAKFPKTWNVNFRCKRKFFQTGSRLC